MSPVGKVGPGAGHPRMQVSHVKAVGAQAHILLYLWVVWGLGFLGGVVWVFCLFVFVFFVTPPLLPQPLPDEDKTQLGLWTCLASVLPLS